MPVDDAVERVELSVVFKGTVVVNGALVEPVVALLTLGVTTEVEALWVDDTADDAADDDAADDDDAVDDTLADVVDSATDEVEPAAVVEAEEGGTPVPWKVNCGL